MTIEESAPTGIEPGLTSDIICARSTEQVNEIVSHLELQFQTFATLPHNDNLSDTLLTTVELISIL